MSKTRSYLAKRNQEGSYSIAVPARHLEEDAWVDFYDDKTGRGYQRKETLRERRGREIEDYFRRCVAEGVTPKMFEMTANTRSRADAATIDVSFDPLDDDGLVGFLRISTESPAWMVMIDGATRLLGIEKAVTSGAIDRDTTFDVRLFEGLSVPQEIALFLLINEKQKRVRTDLGVRVVQRYLDDGVLTEDDLRAVDTVVPDTDQWRYEASRIAGSLNRDADSPWNDLIQMPGDTATKPIKLQAFWTSMKLLLDDGDIVARLRALEAAGTLPLGSPTAFMIAVMKNFWGAVADVNPDARAEPRTTVLWGSIGVNSCHHALARILKTMLEADAPDLTKERLSRMLEDSLVADYDYWFTKPGSRRGEYPGQKGEATTMTGGSGYGRLANELEKDWRAKLHAAGPSKKVLV